MRRFPLRVLMIASLLGCLAAGCGGGAGGAPADGGSPPPAEDPSVDQRLQSLGAEQPDGPRLDENGEPLPDDYSPLGARRRMGVTDSIGLVGWLAWLQDPMTYRLSTLEPSAGDPSVLAVHHQVLSDDLALATYSPRAGWMPLSRHAACGIDLDGDGLDEQVIAYLQDATATQSQIRLRIFVPESKLAPAGERDALLLDEVTTVHDLALASGDLDGDGVPELILGYSTDVGGMVRIAKVESGDLVLTPFQRLVPAASPGATVAFEIEVGQLDHDASMEIVVARNEFTSQARGIYTVHPGTCQVWDDLGTGLQVLLDEPLGIEVSQTPRMALAIDPAVGDIDADGLDEVVFGGVYDSSTHNVGRYLVRVRDDAAHGLALLSERAISAEVGRDGASYSEKDDVDVYYVHVGVVDFEGDSAGEIHVNEVVYKDWAQAAPWTKWLEIPAWFPKYGDGLITKPASPSGDRVDQTTTAMVKGDFDGDGREDLAVWAMRRGAIAVWGWDTRVATPAFRKLTAVDLPPDRTEEGDLSDRYDANPVIFRATLDDEATLLEFEEHQIFTTEPAVVAVIAAPPTLGRDQNLDGSETAYGQSTSSSTSTSAAVGFSLGFVAGSEFKQWGNGWEVEVQMRTEWGRVFETSEQRTDSISYSTGWSEDSVVCTVATYDRYVYRVIAHPNPDAVGQLVNLDVPRGKPQTFQVERTFYNDNIARAATRIGSDVLGHTIGVPESYPSVQERDRLAAENEGTYTDPAPVSQGQQGAIRRTLTLSTNQTTTRFVTFAFDFEAKTTVVGITLGGTFSASKTDEWSWSYGTETSFEGAVGSLHANAFIEESYSFGLLAYWHTDASNAVGYQVVTYYVPRSAP